MRAQAGSAAGSGRENEDLALVGEDWAVVLDGARPSPGVATGCVHSVRWVTHRLGSNLRDRLDRHRGTLADALREAIRATAADHGPTCDVSHPRALGATVAALRVDGGRVEWLVLGDAAAAVEDATGQVTVTTDDRLARLPDPPDTDAGIRAYVARYRNQPGGFWVASTVPAAADHALTGQRPVDQVRRALLCTNGITRLVDRYGYRWADLLTIADTPRGPAALVDAVRGAEQTDPEPGRWPGKRHDDATAVLVRPTDRPAPVAGPGRAGRRGHPGSRSNRRALPS